MLIRLWYVYGERGWSVRERKWNNKWHYSAFRPKFYTDILPNKIISSCNLVFKLLTRLQKKMHLHMAVAFSGFKHLITGRGLRQSPTWESCWPYKNCTAALHGHSKVTASKLLTYTHIHTPMLSNTLPMAKCTEFQYCSPLPDSPDLPGVPPISPSALTNKPFLLLVTEEWERKTELNPFDPRVMKGGI